MISWMQKHRKYLVVTIWVSVIAFVGAGFVGWGSYSFSNSSNLVASVDDKEINYPDLQSEYNRIYSFYAQMFGDNFNQELAKNLRLEEVAVKNLIENSLYENLAEDYGIKILDEEVSKEIISMESFWVEGKFNKDRYILVLNNSRLKPKDFEEQIRKSLLIQKIKESLKLPNTALELEVFKNLQSVEDNLSVLTISKENLDLNYSRSDIEKFWSGKKDNYKSKTEYLVKLVEHSVDSVELSEAEIEEFYNSNKNDFVDINQSILPFEIVKDEVELEAKFKSLKKVALREYLKLKKDELNIESIKIAEDDFSYSLDILEALRSNNAGDTLKPIRVDNGYASLKIVEVISPKTLAFDDAFDRAKEDFLVDFTKTALEQEAKSKLDSFEGKNIGFVSKSYENSIENLTDDEKSEFLDRVFESKSANGYVLFNDKVTLFTINSQRFAENDQSLDSFSENIDKIKGNILNNNILKLLEKKYQINLYYKGN